MRSGLAAVGIVALALASCATVPTPQEANDAVLMLQKYDAWAWAVGIALIWADLVLPVPQTVVIAALGIIYGTVLGSLLGSVGLITGGLLGYVVMLTSARRLVQRFVGPRSLNTMESLFERAGAWAIVLTRSLPYSIPEAMVFLAGLADMPIGKFTVALAVGSMPTAFAFAAIGAVWADQPILALGASYVLPILLLRAVSHAPPSIVRDVNDTRHSSPRGLADCVRGALITRCRWASPSVQHACRPSSQEPRAGPSKPRSVCPVLPLPPELSRHPGG